MEYRNCTILMAALKLFFTLVVSVYPLAVSGHFDTFFAQPVMISLILLLLSLNILSELAPKISLLFLLLSLSINGCLFFAYNEIFILILPMLLIGILSKMSINPLYGILLAVLYRYSGEYQLAYILSVLFFCTIYYMVNRIIGEQIDIVNKTFKKENQLKSTLNDIHKKHQMQLAQTAIIYENQRLQEKSLLSQNLHDRIGHAINGSIFKLEGAKLLVVRDSGKCETMIEDVIGLLRTSVDEIRALLRNEKPGLDTISINQLETLLVDFSQKYGIETSFVSEGDPNRVPIQIWGVLYENTVEALTNSIKYSQCTEISAKLIVYNKILRYLISDNGMGADKIVEDMGLKGMKERVHTVGGTVSVSGENGFEINMLIPLRSGEDE